MPTRRTARKQAKRAAGEWRCHYCRRKFGKKSRTGKTCTIDHVIPQSLGGPDERWNRVLACAPCNSAKGSLTYEWFTGRDQLPQQCWVWHRTTQEFLIRQRITAGMTPTTEDNTQ